ncbi:amidohydrolase [Acidaminobacter sp. JC074]|uniref:amidohydrolase family protein n=1 Tax=Acidaminobacter sp. JC074 TaxID=2530199 RepID=UPI001F0F758D|nr:amidohydrolase family protein [Acidaminobacter sp. JC074]MCH4886479.1 amidohydrolase [Acidaminobacter sp. JC074]
MYDLIIKNGTVADFDSMSFKDVDIAIKDGKIVKIEKDIMHGGQVIDVSGAVVAPGIIDSHMHEEKLIDLSLPIDYDISNRMLKMGVTTCIAGQCGFNFNGLDGIKKFKSFMKKKGGPVNYIFLAGYTTLREDCGVKDRYQEASDEDIDAILDRFKDYYNQGVAGISFGLEYSPGTTESEFLKFVKRLKDTDLLLSAHFRQDGPDAPDSIRELVEASRLSGLPMRVSHIGSCSALGYMTESLDIIQKAREEGLKVDADCYPYDAFSTFIGSAVFDDGWQERLNVDYSAITLTCDPYKNVVCDKETFDKVRKEYPDMTVVARVMNEKEVIEALRSPFVSIASDGILVDGQGHPRAAGTFPRVLGKFVREDHALSLIEALYKMTLQPAKWVGLDKKGEIKENMDADIFIFNPDTISDKATYEVSDLSPVGISHVILDGKVVLKEGRILDNSVGRVIERSELSHGKN